MPLPAKCFVHHVLFWLRDPGSAEDRSALVRGLETLRAIEVIRGLHIGVPAATGARAVVDDTYSVSELALFNDAGAEAIYQDHPVHQAFIRDCGSLWSRVVVFDSVGD